MIPVYVFSYNRSAHLEHCLWSIERCVCGSRVTVIDDQSDDASTKRVLDSFASRGEVVVPKADAEEYKTGGLYFNMNVALDLAEERGQELVLFLQDDTQLVRPLLEWDFTAMTSVFRSDPCVLQYQCFFRRADWRLLDSPSVHLDASGQAFRIADDVANGKDWFSAVGVFNVPRVRELLGAFRVGELKNSEASREAGVRQAIASYPFAHWLPYPNSYRGKKRSLEHRLIEYVGDSGFHPIDIMGPDTVQRLLLKDPCELPVAEKWLHAPTAPRHERWGGGGKRNLLARGGRRLAVLRALGAARRVLRKASRRASHRGTKR